MKVIDYIYLMIRRPNEAYARIEGILDSRVEPVLRGEPVYETIALRDAVRNFTSLIGNPTEFDEILREHGLQAIENVIVDKIKSLPPGAPFGTFQNGDLLLGRICYAICRLLRPRTVIETGVCYGVTTSYVLKALDVNQEGVLHSIDLPALGRGADNYVGAFVPDGLRNRWILHRGASRIVLPSILKQIGNVELFIHDSLHTHRNMSREFDMVTPCLGRPGVVISDDIEGNSAFNEWVQRASPQFSAVMKEEHKRSLFGIAVFAKEELTN